jgi:uncharacterized protein (TIGR00290 family)
MKVAVLWTGGKDSSLAYYKIMRRNVDVALIASFIWDQAPLSHPLPLIRLQSQALQIPISLERVSPPYFKNYRQALIELQEDFGVEAVATGDISTVDSFHGNWIDEVCKDTGIEVIKPLWEMNRQRIVEALLRNGFKAIFTCVKKPWFNEEWLGRMIDSESIKELVRLNQETGMDICGENGEYHTMTMDGPFYKKAIRISKFETEEVNDAYVMKPLEIGLVPKGGEE